jgi:hypothetical protein
MVNILEGCGSFAADIVNLRIRPIEVPGFHFPDKEHLRASKVQYLGTVSHGG